MIYHQNKPLVKFLQNYKTFNNISLLLNKIIIYLQIIFLIDIKIVNKLLGRKYLEIK